MITRMIVRASRSTALQLLLLATAVFLSGCGSDQPIAPDTQQNSEAAAKSLKKGISVEKLKTPRSVTRPDGRVVEKRVHVFYKTGFGRQGESPGKGKGDQNTKCFDFLAKGARWITTEPYVLDTSNGDGLRNSFVAATIKVSLETWNSAAGSAVFGSRDNSHAVDGADDIAPDGLNEVLFANIDEPGVIAVTIVWGIFGGKPADRKLVEWDMIFDDPVLGELGLGLSWGDAGETSETELGDTTIMDLQSIVTHELGHAAGLDHPNTSCVEETMSAFASEGETNKRTLNTGDIEGITQLYQWC